jgi:hypothetical protein
LRSISRVQDEEVEDAKTEPDSTGAVCTAGIADRSSAPLDLATSETESTSSSVSSSAAGSVATATVASNDSAGSTMVASVASSSSDSTGGSSSASSSSDDLAVEWNVYNTDLVRKMMQFELASALSQHGVVSPLFAC